MHRREPSGTAASEAAATLW